MIRLERKIEGENGPTKRITVETCIPSELEAEGALDNGSPHFAPLVLEDLQGSEDIFGRITGLLAGKSGQGNKPLSSKVRHSI